MFIVNEGRLLPSEGDEKRRIEIDGNLESFNPKPKGTDSKGSLGPSS